MLRTLSLSFRSSHIRLSPVFVPLGKPFCGSTNVLLCSLAFTGPFHMLVNSHFSLSVVQERFVRLRPPYGSFSEHAKQPGAGIGLLAEGG